MSESNKNISRNSNNTPKRNSNISSTSNRSNNYSSSNSISSILVKSPICSSERDATPVFLEKQNACGFSETVHLQSHV